MKILKSLGVLTGLALAGAMCAAPASASLVNQLTKVTFDNPVEIPGKVLPPGTYEFKVIDTQADLNQVEVLSGNGMHAIAIENTIPVNPSGTNGQSEVLLQKTGKNQPEMLKEWFYGQGMDGHQFLYPNNTVSK
jgi:hypothetical protein